MSIHELVKQAEGRVWTPDDTAEVERQLRLIDDTAQAAVQLEKQRAERQPIRHA